MIGMGEGIFVGAGLQFDQQHSLESLRFEGPFQEPRWLATNQTGGAGAKEAVPMLVRVLELVAAAAAAAVVVLEEKKEIPCAPIEAIVGVVGSSWQWLCEYWPLAPDPKSPGP